MRSRLNEDDRSIIEQWVDKYASTDDGTVRRIHGAVSAVLSAVVVGRVPCADDCEQVLAWMRGWRRAEVIQLKSGRTVAAFVVLMTAALDRRVDSVGGRG